MKKSDDEKLNEPIISSDMIKKSLREKLPQSRLLKPAMDYMDGILYYVVNTSYGDCIVTSERKIDLLKKVKNKPSIAHNLNFKPYSLVEEYTQFFSKERIADFTEGKESMKNIKAVKAYTEIYNYLTDYIFFHDEVTPTFITLWIMGTYVHRMFGSYPYMHFNAPKGCGKTFSMNLMQALSFNGWNSTVITPAALYRFLETHSGTLFLDEVEQYTGKKGDVEKNGDIMAILKSGYQINGKVVRCGTAQENHVMKSFNTYSAKCFASINELEPALRDRTITLHLQRRLSTEKSKIYPNDDADKIRQQEIRDYCYGFALSNVEAISNFISSKTYFSNSQDRDRELWFPIVVMAELVDRDNGNHKIKEKILEFKAQSTITKQEDDLFDDKTIQLLLSLPEFLDDNMENGKDETEYTSSEIATYLYMNVEAFKFLEDNKGAAIIVGRLMRILGFNSRHKKFNKTTKRIIIVERNRVMDLLKRYTPMLELFSKPTVNQRSKQ